MNVNIQPNNAKKCLVLATGGTIASSQSANGGGLSPSVGIADVLRRAGNFSGISVDAVDLMAVDSSNIQPEEWVAIARRIADARHEYSGIVLTHGTDTMAYTASALSFMLRGIGIPVVLTGSQLPVTDPLSDAPANLHASLAVACSPGLRGIYVCFARRVMLGCRTVKVRTESFDAFESINYPAVGKIDGRGLEFTLPRPTRCSAAEETADGAAEEAEDFSFDLDTRVFLVKLTPGFDPAVFDMLRRMDYRGIVIEAFGAGGVQFIRRDLGAEIRSLTADGVPVVVASQCLYEPADPGIYEVGRRALESGAVSARDMTTEAAVTKLMWALPRAIASGDTVEYVRRMFDTNISGEVSI